jgi:hypothetical protein
LRLRRARFLRRLNIQRLLRLRRLTFRRALLLHHINHLRAALDRRAEDRVLRRTGLKRYHLISHDLITPR